MFENLEWRLIAKDEATATFKKVEQAQKSLNDVTEKQAKATEKAGSSWKSIAGGVLTGTAAFSAAQKTLGFLKETITSSIQEAAEYQRNQAQLNAVLTSTKGAAGVSIDALNQMARELQNLTAIDDDVINSLQAMQLTFTNITGPVFKETTQAAIDMATAMNGGTLPAADQLRSTMIQLGKALNNPVDGISALTRVGVAFTDQQKKQIETLVKSGQVMEAQKVVLAELSKEFGGSAAAAANTYQGQMLRLQNTIGDVKKTIGQALIPTLSVFIGTITTQTGQLELNQTSLKLWQLRIYQAAVIIKGAILTVMNFVKVIWDMGVMVAKVAATVIAAFVEQGKAIMNFGQHAQTIFAAMKQALTGDFSGALNTLKKDFANAFSVSIGFMKSLGETAYKTGTDFVGAMDPMQKAMDDAMNPKAFNALIAKMDEAEQKARSSAAGMIAPMVDAGEKTASAADKIKNALNSAKEKYKEAQTKISEALAQLEADHKEKVSGITSKLKDLRDQLKETEAAYKSAVAGMNQSEAERIVEQEQKIKELKSQLAEQQGGLTGDTEKDAGANKRIAELQISIAQEEAALKAYGERQKSLDKEVAEARRRANLTEFERFMEDQKTKRAELDSEHQKKIAQINEQTAQLTAQLQEEMVVYEAKRKAYQETAAAFKAFHDKYLANLSSMKTATQKTVDDMNAKLKSMIEILNQIESVKKRAGILGAAGLDSGSSTQQNNNQENNQNTQNNNFTINIDGTNLSPREIADEVMSQVTRKMQLAGQGSQ